ncbi:MAG: DUF1566 domain-containing protein, partial [Pseudomonadales bacterium]|nr:DUF1566 domain-containing protein [Pseudomonadales bacterium]
SMPEYTQGVRNIINLDGSNGFDFDQQMSDSLTYQWTWGINQQLADQLNQQYEASCKPPEDIVPCNNIAAQLVQLDVDYANLENINISGVIGDSSKISFITPNVKSDSTYYFSLKVTDNDNDNNEAQTDNQQYLAVTILSDNQAPIVEVTPGEYIFEEAKIFLSYQVRDDDGFIDDVSWEQTSGPTTAILQDMNGDYYFITPEVTVGSPQEIKFEITAVDDESASTTKSVTYLVHGTNEYPYVDAFINANELLESQATTLYLMYYDPDGNVASSSVTYVSGPALTIEGSLDEYTIVVENVIGDQYVELEIQVVDNEEGIFNKKVMFLVQDSNTAAQVSAGADLIASGNSSVVLKGTASDVETLDENLIIVWEQITGDTVELLNSDTLTPSFIAPILSSDSVIEFKLTVTDLDDGELALSSSDSVKITILDYYPYLSIGEDLTIDELVEHHLTSSVGLHDPAEIVEHTWSVTHNNVTTALGNNVWANFTSENIIGDSQKYTITLSINTDMGTQMSTSIILTVLDTNQTPIASAGKDKTVASNLNSYLDGSDSFDNENQSLNYFWTQIIIDKEQKLNQSFFDEAKPAFITPIVTETTEFTFELAVKDEDGFMSVEADQVVITVKPDMNKAVNDTGIDNNQCSDFAYEDYTYSHQSQLDCSLLFDPIEGDPIPAGQDGHYESEGMNLTEIIAGTGELPNETACMLDNITKLMWQVQKSDTGYGWYDNDPSTNGGAEGNENEGSNTQDYTANKNAQQLCGYADWRLPTREELISIAHYGKTNAALLDDIFRTIGHSSVGDWLIYSSDTVVDDINKVWVVQFNSAQETQVNKVGFYPIMLVRDNNIINIENNNNQPK